MSEGLQEKASITFAGNRRTSSRSGNIASCHAASAALREMDSVLEDRLIKGGKTSANLTRREAEVLRFVLAGKTNKEMARILCRAERTIEYHRNRLMRKLGVHNVAELVKCAITMGLA